MHCDYIDPPLVTITSSSSPPYKIGSTIQLQCSISPDPTEGRPVQLYYFWKGNDGRFSTSYSTSPNVTLTIPASHYETSYYFCEVYIRSRSYTLLSTGNINIETESELIIIYIIISKAAVLIVVLLIIESGNDIVIV